MELFIAIYGALLSTALLLNELLQQRKKLSIILEHVAWYETVQVIITNVGRRTLTLVEMKIDTIVGTGENAHWEMVPKNALLNIDDPFPITLKDGEAVSIPLGNVLAETLINNRINAKIEVYDSQGKKYSDYKSRTYDAKWGGYHNIP